MPLLSDGGRIINISSSLTRTSAPNVSAYASMKAQVYANCNLSVLNDEDQVYTQITSTGRVSDNMFIYDPNSQKDAGF